MDFYLTSKGLLPYEIPNMFTHTVMIKISINKWLLINMQGYKMNMDIV